MTAQWHQFRDTEDGDDECASCGVIVAPASLTVFSLACPVRDCAATANPDGRCVFAPSRAAGAACVYCGASGTSASADEEPPLSDFEADLLGADTDDDVSVAVATHLIPDDPTDDW